MNNELKQTINKMQMKTKENEIKIKQRKKSLMPNKKACALETVVPDFIAPGKKIVSISCQKSRKDYN